MHFKLHEKPGPVEHLGNNVSPEAAEETAEETLRRISVYAGQRLPGLTLHEVIDLAAQRVSYSKA